MRQASLTGQIGRNAGLLTICIVILGVGSPLAWAQTPADTPAEDLYEFLLQKRAARTLLNSMGKDTHVDRKVDRLVDMLVLPDKDKVQAAVTALVSMGPAAVPEMIRRVDDRRLMVVRAFSFENKGPHAFEGVRHNGGELVVDCLNLVLNAITGDGFEPVDVDLDTNLRDPEFRRRADVTRARIVAGWRGYLARTSLRAPGKTLPGAGPARQRMKR